MRALKESTANISSEALNSRFNSASVNSTMSGKWNPAFCEDVLDAAPSVLQVSLKAHF
jgi:hypothetical protein